MNLNSFEQSQVSDETLVERLCSLSRYLQMLYKSVTG